MLSYRHSFHAGNFADIIKHIVLVESLGHLVKKETPFDYIDSHAGAGLFDFTHEHSVKLGEHHRGIGKLRAEDWPELAAYFKILSSYNKDQDAGEELRFYPGSPLIASHFMRGYDNAWLYELHPTDFDLLVKNTNSDKRMHVMKEDGLKGILAHVPPVSRRAFVLMDPSYEIKSDYENVVASIHAAYKKFPQGVYALWYPVIDRARVLKLEQRFIDSGMKDIQRFELGLLADGVVRGMTSSGMIVVNPHWGLFDKMSQLLPKLVETLGEDGAFFKCDVLVDE